MIDFANEGDMLTVGKLLKNERERQELTLEDISDRTKINVKYLKAIEDDKKEGFPGALYAELFTKSYAEALGLEYEKIKAGTFAMPDGDEEDKKSRRSESKARTKGAKKARKPENGDQATEKKEAEAEEEEPEPGLAFVLAEDTSKATDDTAEPPPAEPEEDVEQGADKSSIVKYLAVTGAVVICLLIVVIYISISADKGTQPSSEDRPAVAVEDSSEVPEDTSSVGDEPSDSGLEAKVDEAEVLDPDDTVTEGPVSIYPDSLEVLLTSTQESWASVVADGDTVFTSFLKPTNEKFFSASEMLEITLGRWEYVRGSIYGHPMKEMQSFHREGWNSVRLRITKDNWESFLDSSRLEHE